MSLLSALEESKKLQKMREREIMEDGRQTISCERQLIRDSPLVASSSSYTTTPYPIINNNSIDRAGQPEQLWCWGVCVVAAHVMFDRSSLLLYE